MNGNTNNIKFKNNLGYTLLEVLVVVALLIIIMSMVIPSMQIVSNIREKTELMQFKKDIVYSRNNAIIENKIYAIYLDNDKNSYKILEVGKNTKVIKDVQFSNGIKFKGNNFGGSINFSPAGSPSKGGIITMSNRKNQKIEITITPATGKVNLYIKEK